MDNLSKEQKKEILDSFGKLVISHVRDGVLYISMGIARCETCNPVKIKQYKDLEGLTAVQQEAVCDLLSETITDTIYRFMEMFEENPDKMKMLVEYEGKEFDLAQISEVMGSDIARLDEEGWIQRFSEIGRFVS